MQVTGCVAVVTGATAGIGREIAALLAARGAIVVAVGRNREALAEVTSGTNGTFLAVDVREPNAADRVVAHALEHHGRLDVVVANAGVGWLGSFAEMPADRLRELVEVNLTAPLQLARAAVPALAERGGAIVFVSSIAGAVPVPGETVYSTTKAGIEAFAQTLRSELGRRPVRVGTVLPGPVDTEFFERRGAPYARSFPRPIQPAAVANAVLRMIEHDRTHAFVPRWLALPAAMYRLAPRGYLALARRFG